MKVKSNEPNENAESRRTFDIIERRRYNWT